MSHRRRSSKIYIALKHGETIVKDLHTQFKEGRNCDLEIRLDKKRLYVHKCLIDIFFMKAGAELEDDRFYLDLTRYSQEVVEALIGLVYTGNLHCALDQVENVYKAAAELGCVEAQSGCQTYLREHGIPVVMSTMESSGSSSPPTIHSDPFSAPPVETVEAAVPVSCEVKTEPLDEHLESDDHRKNTITSGTRDSSSCTRNYRSTYLVPVSDGNIGTGRSTYNRYELDHHRNNVDKSVQQIYRVSPHPALPVQLCNKISPKKKQTDIHANKGKSIQNTSNETGKRKGRIPKVAVLEKDMVDRIKSLSNPKRGQTEASISMKKNVEAPKTEPKSKLYIFEKKKDQTVKHNSSTTTKEIDLNDSAEEMSNKDNLVEYRTKSGIVYYKSDPNSLTRDEFSVDTDEGDQASATLRCTSSKENSLSRNQSTVNTNEKAAEKKKTLVDGETVEYDEQTVLQQWMASVTKTVTETDNGEISSIVATNSTGTDMDAELEARKNEQMFSLGLTKKSDEPKDESTAANSGKRRLRKRKKVDYSCINIEKDDLDDSSDYDPLEEDQPTQKSRFVHATKGRNLKIDNSLLVTVPTSKAYSSTIAVRQDFDMEEVDDGVEHQVYFPPAGTVPEGVKSSDLLEETVDFDAVPEASVSSDACHKQLVNQDEQCHMSVWSRGMPFMKHQWIIIRINQKNFKFPKRSFGQKKLELRAFNPQWFDQRPWLHYDELEEKKADLERQLTNEKSARILDHEKAEEALAQLIVQHAIENAKHLYESDMLAISLDKKRVDKEQLDAELAEKNAELERQLTNEKSSRQLQEDVNKEHLQQIQQESLKRSSQMKHIMKNLAVETDIDTGLQHLHVQHDVAEPKQKVSWWKMGGAALGAGLVVIAGYSLCKNYINN